MDGWVVTGTDTGVGKTLVSALLCLRWRAHGRVGYVKPVQSGAADGDDDAADVRAMADVPVASGVHLGPSLAPAVAARLAGASVTREDLLAPVDRLVGDTGVDRLVVEGAGGLLVELGTDGTTVADLAATLGLAVLVVARPGLGTLNHTALTVEAIGRRGLELAGVVVCGHEGDADLAARTNLDELQRLTGGALAGVVPRLTTVSPQVLAEGAGAWLGGALGGSWRPPP